jgi:hypothetical protein
MPYNFDTNPPIRTFQYSSYALGAALALPTEGRALINNYFIQLECPKKLGHRGHLLRFYPLISPLTYSVLGLGPQVIVSPSDGTRFIDALTSLLKGGFFVRLLVDEYYIPHRRAHGKEHRLHDIVVLDFEYKEDGASIIGYCADGRYRVSRCSASDLAKGFFSKSTPRSKVPHFVGYMFRPRRELRTDPELIRNQLAGLISGIPPIPHPPYHVQPASMGAHYGCHAYEFVVAYLEGLSPGTDSVDTSPFSLLLDHATAMRMRVASLEHEQLLSDGSEPLAIMNDACALAKRLETLSLVTGRGLTLHEKEIMIALTRSLKTLVLDGANAVLSRL